MFKKFILIIFVLFLAVPTAFADDSSIIPVILLLKNSTNNQIKRLNSIEEFASVNTDTFPIKTFILKGNTVEEFKSVNLFLLKHLF